jgi:hypothetical protein
VRPFIISLLMPKKPMRSVTQNLHHQYGTDAIFVLCIDTDRAPSHLPGSWNGSNLAISYFLGKCLQPPA